MRFGKTILSLFVVLAVLPCLGEEIVNFKSGQTMPIKSHTIREGMVHCDLGENGFVAFPESAIESIEVAGKNVMILPSFGIGANRRVPDPAGSYPAKGLVRKPDFEISPLVPDDEGNGIERDERTGMAIVRPMGHSRAPNKRELAVTGQVKSLGDNPTRRGDGKNTYAGTTQLGTRHVIGGIHPRRSNGDSNRPQAASVTMKPGVAAKSGASDSKGDKKN